MTDATRELDDRQRALWNGPGGHAWVEAQALLDRMYTPFEDLLVDAVSAVARRAVLDVGCGTGGTTVAVARRLGAGFRCTGVDVSEPMIAAARARAARDGVAAMFVHADAQVHAFEPASVDVIMSRFGVMFFGNPVGAFANLRRAATDDAALRCIAWRSAAENPFMTTAEHAAAPLLPNLARRQPDAPGQFAFANQDRVRRILEEGGWSAVDLRPIDLECAFPEADLTSYLSLLGPVGIALRDADDRTRAAVIPTVRDAFDPYVFGAEVRFTAACWLISARAGLP